MSNKNHINKYFNEVSIISNLIDRKVIDKIALEILKLKEKKEDFFLSVLVVAQQTLPMQSNDFRKLCGIECYSPIDNVSELNCKN